MVRQNQIILSDTFSYHTKTNDMSINNLDMELTTSKKQHQVYVSAKTFIDKGTIKKGEMGKSQHAITTHPYHFEAETFTILPDKRIVDKM